MASGNGKLTAAEIAESKRQAQIAFYRLRSESLRNSHTTTDEGVLSTSNTKPKPDPRKQQQPPRGGILGAMADRVMSALGGQ